MPAEDGLLGGRRTGDALPRPTEAEDAGRMPDRSDAGLSRMAGYRARRTPVTTEASLFARSSVEWMPA